MATTSTDAETLQQQMRAIRSELGVEVHDLVRNAREMTDWRVYVRRYPWACLGAAAALGFLAVPERRKKVVPDAQSLFELAKDHKLVVQAASSGTRGPGIASRLTGLLVGVAVRAGLNILAKKLNPLVDELSTRPAQPPACEEDANHDQSH